MGTPKPIFGRRRISGGTSPRTASRSILFPVRPRIRQASGRPIANSTTSRRGTASGPRARRPCRHDPLSGECRRAGRCGRRGASPVRAAWRPRTRPRPRRRPAKAPPHPLRLRRPRVSSGAPAPLRRTRTSRGRGFPAAGRSAPRRKRSTLKGRVKFPCRTGRSRASLRIRRTGRAGQRAVERRHPVAAVHRVAGEELVAALAAERHGDPLAGEGAEQGGRQDGGVPERLVEDLRQPGGERERVPTVIRRSWCRLPIREATRRENARSSKAASSKPTENVSTGPLRAAMAATVAESSPPRGRRRGGRR